MIRERLTSRPRPVRIWPSRERRRRCRAYRDASRDRELVRFAMLRQQASQPDGKPNLCLADFVAPVGSGIADHVGAFAVTSGPETDDLARAFEKDLDDYNAILVKALADRLAEAFAEYLHVARGASGATEPTSASRTRSDRRALPRHPPAFATRPAPTTPARPLFHCSLRRRSARADRKLAMRPGQRVGLYFGHLRPLLTSAGRPGDRSRALRSAPECPGLKSSAGSRRIWATSRKRSDQRSHTIFDSSRVEQRAGLCLRRGRSGLVEP